MTITTRPYVDEQDYEAIRVMLRECYARYPLVYCTLGDLDWWRSGESNPQTPAIQIWLDQQRVVGLAWPSDDQIDLICHPDHRPLEEELLIWGEQWRRTTADPTQQPLTFSTWAFHGDLRRAALYERRGYKPEGMALNYRTRPLMQPIPDLALPAGYRIRHLRGPEEIEARVAVHRDAFAPSRMTLARHQTAMHLPTYRIDLDLVVEAPDQSLAAFCIIWHDEANRMGLFEPVGCHSAHRRRGLTRALMAEGLRKLRDMGAHTAHVNSLAGDPASEPLYESLGFAVVDRNERWQAILG